MLPVPGAEVAAHGGEHLRIVVHDEEDGLVQGVASGDVALGERQHDPKLRPARLRLDVDFAVVVADEAPDDVEAQAGALPHRLGGEERVEDALADLCGDAGPVVDDAHHHALMLAVRQHLDAARVGDGVEGVVDQIRPDLVEFAGEAADARETGFHVNGHGGRFRPRFGLEHGDRVAQTLLSGPPARQPLPDPCG